MRHYKFEVTELSSTPSGSYYHYQEPGNFWSSMDRNRYGFSKGDSGEKFYDDSFQPNPDHLPVKVLRNGGQVWGETDLRNHYASRDENHRIYMEQICKEKGLHHTIYNPAT